MPNASENNEIISIERCTKRQKIIDVYISRVHLYRLRGFIVCVKAPMFRTRDTCHLAAARPTNDYLSMRKKLRLPLSH